MTVEEEREFLLDKAAERLLDLCPEHTSGTIQLARYLRELGKRLRQEQDA